MAPKFLHKFPSFAANDSFVGIFKDFPFLFRSVNLGLIFKRACRRTKINRMSAVFKPFQNICNRSCRPLMGYGRKCRCLSTLCLPIFCWCWNTLRKKGYLLSVSVRSPPHISGIFCVQSLRLLHQSANRQARLRSSYNHKG